MIYAFADCHLGHAMRNVPEIADDSFLAMEEAARIILNDKTTEEKTVIIAGDIFDKRAIPGKSLKCFSDFMKRMGDIRVFFVQGNHDINEAAFAEVEGAVRLSSEPRVVDHKLICGIDWQLRSLLPTTLALLPECDILVMHQAFEHLLSFDNAFDLNLDEVPGTVKNVIVGDVHTRNLIKFRDSGWCLSPGPTHACNIEQKRPHGVHRLSESGNEWEFLPMITRDVRRYSVTAIGDIEKIIEELRGLSDAILPLCEVKYNTELTNETQAAMPVIKTMCVPVFKRCSTGIVSSDILAEARAVASNLTMLDAVDLLISRNDEKQVHDLLCSLLRSEIPQEVLKQWSWEDAT